MGYIFWPYCTFLKTRLLCDDDYSKTLPVHVVVQKTNKQKNKLLVFPRTNGN